MLASGAGPRSEHTLNGSRFQAALKPVKFIKLMLVVNYAYCACWTLGAAGAAASGAFPEPGPRGFPAGRLRSSPPACCGRTRAWSGIATLPRNQIVGRSSGPGAMTWRARLSRSNFSHPRTAALRAASCESFPGWDIGQDRGAAPQRRLGAITPRRGAAGPRGRCPAGFSGFVSPDRTSSAPYLSEAQSED